MNRGTLTHPRAHDKLRKKIGSALRRYIYSRDKYKCQHPDCTNPSPGDKYLTIHHLDYDPANNDPSNLITCCQTCNARDRAMHYAAARRKKLLYASLHNYHTRQTSFHFDP